MLTNGIPRRLKHAQTHPGSAPPSGSPTGRHLPLLRHCLSDPEIAVNRPLERFGAIVALHVLPNIVPVLDGLARAGLEPRNVRLFFKPYRYPHKERVLAWLTDRDYSPRPVEELVGDPVGALHVDLPTLVLEDGGYAGPALVRAGLDTGRVAGVVEQTTRGLRGLQRAVADGHSPKFPVLALPFSQLKLEFEPPLIAAAVCGSLEWALPVHIHPRMSMAVLGCGTLGREIARRAVAFGTHVRAFDPDPMRRLIASVSTGAVIAETAEEAVAGADLVVGACGACSVNASVLAAMKAGAFVASAGSERLEIDMEYLERIAVQKAGLFRDDVDQLIGESPIGTTYHIGHSVKAVNVLADGFPINFRFLGMGDAAADLIVTLLALGVLDLANGKFAGKTGIIPGAFDEISARHNLPCRYLSILRT